MTLRAQCLKCRLGPVAMESADGLRRQHFANNNVRKLTDHTQCLKRAQVRYKSKPLARSSHRYRSSIALRAQCLKCRLGPVAMEPAGGLMRHHFAFSNMRKFTDHTQCLKRDPLRYKSKPLARSSHRYRSSMTLRAQCLKCRLAQLVWSQLAP